jgi:hypothetical protein
VYACWPDAGFTEYVEEIEGKPIHHLPSYILTDEDKNAIKRRNYTFHGHLSDIKKELGEQRWDMLAVALRLHKLCCILLLKAAGYSGRIWNNEVIMGVEEACKRKDPPYLNI